MAQGAMVVMFSGRVVSTGTGPPGSRGAAWSGDRFSAGWVWRWRRVGSARTAGLPG